MGLTFPTQDGSIAEHSELSDDVGVRDYQRGQVRAKEMSGHRDIVVLTLCMPEIYCEP